MEFQRHFRETHKPRVQTSFYMPLCQFALLILQLDSISLLAGIDIFALSNSHSPSNSRKRKLSRRRITKDRTNALLNFVRSDKAYGRRVHLQALGKIVHLNAL